MKLKYKKILMYVCIVLVVVSAVLITLHIFKISDQMNIDRAQKYGFEYAKKDCEKTLPSDICGNLEVYTYPPTAWNEVNYIVYVQGLNMKDFDANVTIQIDIHGNIKVIEYDRYDVGNS